MSWIHSSSDSPGLRRLTFKDPRAQEESNADNVSSSSGTHRIRAGQCRPRMQRQQLTAPGLSSTETYDVGVGQFHQGVAILLVGDWVEDHPDHLPAPLLEGIIQGGGCGAGRQLAQPQDGRGCCTGWPGRPALLEAVAERLQSRSTQGLRRTQEASWVCEICESKIFPIENLWLVKDMLHRQSCDVALARANTLIQDCTSWAGQISGLLVIKNRKP